MGKNKIGQFLSSATKNLPTSTSGKFTNHSVRKTCIKTLLDSGVSHKNVAQLSGHKSLKVWIAMLWRPVNSNGKCRKYSVGKKTTLSPNRSQMHRRKISKLIQVAATCKDPCQQSSSFFGASIRVLNIQNLVSWGFQFKSSSWHFSAQKKRRRPVIESSDED